ncbi:unnamed protein product [Symbiodinium necroappetens]|uniref:Uncharacterized protein n=1 Tax=Symbiodinium necroappetens TaxID=1628268 RepID=A0A812LQ35_9DINO|nr:unnamed protein product [Symbiodinium necroappetens]
MPTCAKKLLYAGACLVAAGLLTCLVLITLFFIQLGSPGEVLIDGQENFTLTAVEPRIGFTFFREWGTNGTEHCRTLHIISPSGNDVTFWCGVHSISQPQLEKTGHVELNREFGTYTVTSGQATWVVDRYDYWGKGHPQAPFLSVWQSVLWGAFFCSWAVVLPRQEE